jgi:transcriptional regulator of acetoin/glycerol metabolism
LPNTHHSDEVYSSLIQNSSAAGSAVAASWRRSALNYGLDPANHRTQDLVTNAELASIKEANDLLLRVSSPVMDNLFKAIGQSGCLVALATKDGFVIERRATIAEARYFDDARLTAGANWHEAIEGTNGIGTCLAEERAITIYRNQHFHIGNIEMSCMDAPIRNHLGRLIGALDVSICQENHNEATANLMAHIVKNAARDIESNYFCHKFSNARIVQIGECVTGTPALIAVDEDDLILGATFGARKVLGLNDEIVNNNMPAADFLKPDNLINPSKCEIVDNERAILRRAMARTNGNIAKAARTLGISRATFYRRMNKSGLFAQL